MDQNTIAIIKGYINKPIFSNNISFCKLIPDMLHLFLRITDKLVLLLISKLNKKYTKIEDNIDKYPLLNSFYLELEKIGVKNSLYYHENQFKPRSLTGKEKKKLFYSVLIDDINLESILPELEKSIQINKVLNNY